MLIFSALVFFPSLPYCGGVGGVLLLPESFTKLWCLLWQFSINAICIVTSSVIYIVILRQKGKLIKPRIGVDPRQHHENSIASISRDIDNRNCPPLELIDLNHQEGFLYYFLFENNH